MSEADVLRHVPLASAAIWLVVGLWLSRRAFRSSPERMFGVFCLLVALWAAVDWMFLQSTDPALALGLARAAASVPPAISLALLYFARWLTRPRGVVDHLLPVPAAAGVGLAWTLFAVQAQITPAGPLVLRNPAGVLLWILLVGSVALLACGYLALALRRATFSSPGTRWKLGAVLAVIVFGFVVWLYENVTLVPVWSARSTSEFLLVVGVAILAIAVRIDPQRAHRIVRRFLVTPSRPSIAVWYHKSGNPIAQLVVPGEQALDADSMSDVARAIEHVVSTGTGSTTTALREMRVGNHVLMFEDGAYLRLFVLVRGAPSAGLRSELRAAIIEFEALDGTRLHRWETATELAEPALRFLEEILSPSYL